jgi:leucyl/phenylalanyl-tRNA--protein transferase
MPVFRLSESLVFPPPERAERGGLLAMGGDLSPQRLLLAYEQGIFPWFSDGEPILWWSPDPRFVLFPKELKVSASMRQVLRRNVFRITFDQAFAEVIAHCQQIPRPGQDGTWITAEVQAAYTELHRLGFAHSVEVWQGDDLAGGLYGVSLGSCFFGESMFARVSNASKAGFITLVQALEERNFQLIDCQIYTPHLESLGARGLRRRDFLIRLAELLRSPTWQGSWGGWREKASPA